MTSPTGKTKVRRALRKAAMGSKRKNAVRSKGTTSQLFALNKPTETEKAGKTGAKAIKKTVASTKTAKTAAPKKAAAPKAATPKAAPAKTTATKTK